MRKHTAFTLLELSVVLVIIGIITFGVIQSGNMITSARVSIARSLTNRSIVPEIPGLVAWYESSLKSSFKESESYDGAQLTTWYDNSPASIAQSRNTLTTTASSGIKYETTGINKIPTVQFSASAKFTLTALYQGSTSQNTIFTVFQSSSTLSGIEKVIVDSISSGSSTAVGIKSTGVSLNAGSQITLATTFTARQNYVVASYFNGASSKAYANSNTILNTGVTSSLPGSNQLTGLTIGTAKNGAKPFNGFVPEIIIYNRTLSDRERKDVMGYLAKKYRITVTGLY